VWRSPNDTVTLVSLAGGEQDKYRDYTARAELSRKFSTITIRGLVKKGKRVVRRWRVGQLHDSSGCASALDNSASVRLLGRCGQLAQVEPGKTQV